MRSSQPSSFSCRLLWPCRFHHSMVNALRKLLNVLYRTSLFGRLGTGLGIWIGKHIFFFATEYSCIEKISFNWNSLISEIKQFSLRNVISVELFWLELFEIFFLSFSKSYSYEFAFWYLYFLNTFPLHFQVEISKFWSTIPPNAVSQLSKIFLFDQHKSFLWRFYIK